MAVSYFQHYDHDNLDACVLRVDLLFAGAGACLVVGYVCLLLC